MIREIRAKTLLSGSPRPDPWFGCSYTMNIYRGCQHQCIYCDSRSECYQIENFADVLVKVNAIERLEDELPRKRRKAMICTGAMSDPYQPIEKKLKLSREALEVIAKHKFPIHTMTKSSLILRDKDLLKEVGKVYAVASFTITTVDDELAQKIEPGASLPSERLAAMKELSDNGIYTGVILMPVLPFIEDNENDVKKALLAFHEHGAQYVLPSFGMTLRDRQRDYYYRKLNELFPGTGLVNKYRREFGDRYSCWCRNSKKLRKMAEGLCKELGMATKMRQYEPEQGRLLG